MPEKPISLPLTTFESFMLGGESRKFPMTFSIELEFENEVDCDRLVTAIQNSAATHPLLFATVDRKQQIWVLSHFEEWKSKVHLLPIEGQSLALDLEQENGLRVHADNQKAVLLFHHTCVDGIGAMQFIADVVRDYRKASQQKDSRTIDIAVAYLRRSRSSYGGNRWLSFLRWPLDLLAMIWTFEMVLNRPMPITPEPKNTVASTSTMEDSNLIPRGNVDTILTVEQTSQVKELARSNGQTLNDHVMVAVFRATEEWNEQFNSDACGKLIRLMIPMNLRQSQTCHGANMVAMVNFDRKVGRWSSVSKLRKWLQREMNVVKRFRAGITANRFLHLQKMLLGRWPMQDDPERCLATCIVSNLGDVSALNRDSNNRSENVARIRFVTPLRSKLNVFVCLFSFEGKLNFNLTFNDRILQKHQVEYLLERTIHHLLVDSQQEFWANKKS